MKKTIPVFALAGLLLSISFPGRAEFVTGEIYGGASLGVPIYQDLEKTDVGYKIYGGYFLYDFLALDIAYVDLGNPSKSNQTIEISGVSVSALGSFPINAQISGFVKVGSYVWDASQKPGGGSSGNDFNFGLGANFNAMDNLYIHGELEKYNSGPDSVIMYSLGLVKAF